MITKEILRTAAVVVSVKEVRIVRINQGSRGASENLRMALRLFLGSPEIERSSESE